MKPDGPTHPKSRLEWWFLASLAVVTFVCGFVGLLQYDVDVAHFPGASWSNPASWSVAAYHALQLVGMHGGHLDKELPLLLHVGRWMSVVLVFWALSKVVRTMFREGCLRFRAQWRRDHTVICGLGGLGLPLALQSLAKGRRPVAIEKDPDARGIDVAARAGIPVFVGDATDPVMLQRARVGQARDVLAVCDDAVNINIAVRAGQLASPERPVACRLFISDSELRWRLRQQQIFKTQQTGCRVDVVGLDIHQHRARRAFDEHPLDHRPILPKARGASASLVLVGFGQMGQSLGLQAAHIGHFASHEKLRVMLVDEQLDDLLPAFEARFPKFRELCVLTTHTRPVAERAVRDELLRECLEHGRLGNPVTIAVCHDDADARNLGTALMLLQYLPAEVPVQVLVYLQEGCGLASLLPPGAEQVRDRRLRPFGMTDRIWTLEVLLDEQQDALARGFHAEYRAALEQRRARGEVIEARPAEEPWERLDPTWRQANRAFADHLPVKARALGLHIAPLAGAQDGAVHDFGPDLGLLARMEHERWCAERLLSGWTRGHRDDAALSHPDIVPWVELPEGERQIDRDMMARASRVLERLGLGFFR